MRNVREDIGGCLQFYKMGLKNHTQNEDGEFRILNLWTTVRLASGRVRWPIIARMKEKKP